MQAPADFVGSGVGFPFRSNETSSWYFANIIFGSATYHFFTKLWLLERDSAPPGREREFRAMSFPCRSRIGCN
jgi:hypothetical protein